MNGPVDWSLSDANMDGVSDNDVGVAADINHEGVFFSTLAGAEDWSHLVYAFRQNLYFSPGEVYEPDPDHTELTYDMYLELHEELLAGMSADFDGDDDVDGADCLRWQRGLGAPDAEISDGDADYDDDVDGVDLYVWRSLFGTSDAPSDALAAAVVEPSPSARLDMRALAALWPDLALDCAISAKPAPPPEPVIFDARAIAFSLLAISGHSGDKDADLAIVGDKRFDAEANEAPVHEHLTGPLEDDLGALNAVLV
jgi:hypothetical protein